MPPQSHSLHVYQLWSIIKVINKTAYRKENLTILIFCEAYSKKEKKCFWWHRNSSAMIANKLDLKLTHYTATSIYYKSNKCTNFNIKHFCNHISTCPLFLILVKHLLQSDFSSVVEKQRRFAPIKPFLSLLDPFLSFDSDGRCDSCKQSCCHFASFVSLLQNNIWSFLW